MKGRAPDVIGIGFRRCATSWLHQYLNRHPEIGKVENGVHYFSEHRSQGEAWYFERLGPFADRPVLLDLSVSYSYPEHYREVACAIRDFAPDVRLFASIRNPIERAFSDYKRSVERLEIDPGVTFAEALEREPVFLERGRYGKILAEYLNHFSRAQLLVLFFDDLQHDANGYTKQLLTFLGVSDGVWMDEGEHEPGPANLIHSRRYQSLVLDSKFFVDRLSERLGVGEQWSNLKARYMKYYHRALSWNYRREEIATNVRRQLRAFYADDIRLVESITGRNLDHWS